MMLLFILQFGKVISRQTKNIQTLSDFWSPSENLEYGYAYKDKWLSQVLMNL